VGSEMCIRDRAEGERVLGRVPKQPENKLPKTALSYRQVALNAQNEVVSLPQAAFDNGIEKYLKQAALQAQLEPLLQTLGKELAQGEDYESVQATLLAMYPDMNTDLMEESLARVLFVADLWGRIHDQAHA
ncbi:DUF935 family protein, partial [Kingella kingae]